MPAYRPTAGAERADPRSIAHANLLADLLVTKYAGHQPLYRQSEIAVRDDRRAGSLEPAAVWFTYSPSRQGAHPQRHLAGFKGALQADAYAGFNELFAGGSVREAVCMAHARRKLYDIHVTALFDSLIFKCSWS